MDITSEFIYNEFPQMNKEERQKYLLDNHFFNQAISLEDYVILELTKNLKTDEIDLFFSQDRIGIIANLPREKLLNFFKTIHFPERESYNLFVGDLFENFYADSTYISSVYKNLHSEEQAKILHKIITNLKSNRKETLEENQIFDETQKVISRLLNSIKDNILEYPDNMEESEFIKNLFTYCPYLSDYNSFLIAKIPEYINFNELQNFQKREFIDTFTRTDFIASRSILQNTEIIDFAVRNMDSLSFLRCIKNSTPEKMPFIDKISSARRDFIDTKEFKTEQDICEIFFKDTVKNSYLKLETIIDALDTMPEYKSNFAEDKEIAVRKMYDIIKSCKTEKGFDGRLNNQEEQLNKLYNAFMSSKIDYTNFLNELVDDAKQIFSKQLTNNLNNFNTRTDLEIEEKSGVQIKKLNGEEFDLVVHVSGKPLPDLSENIKKYNNFFSKKTEENYILSTSLISDKNLNLFKNNTLKFGFYNIKEENLVHSSLTDSFSANLSKELDDSYFATVKPDFIDLEKFKESAPNNYSELGFDTKELNSKTNSFKPDCLVCYDKITPQELAIARGLGLEIILIDTQKYEKQSQVSKDLPKTMFSNSEYEFEKI